MKAYQLKVRRTSEKGRTEESVFTLTPITSWGGEEGVAEILMAMELQANSSSVNPSILGKVVRVWIEEAPK